MKNFILLIIFIFSSNSELTSSEKPNIKILPKADGSGQFLFFENFPENRPLTLCFSNFPNHFQKMLTFQFNDGRLIYEGEVYDNIYRNEGGNIYVDTSNFAPGQRASIKIVDKRNTTIFETSYFPKPLAVKSPITGFTLEAELVSPNPSTYLITLTGLHQNEKYHYHSISENEVIEREAIYNKEVQIMAMPGVLGKKGGEAIVTITRSNNEKASLNLLWGTKLPGIAEKNQANNYSATKRGKKNYKTNKKKMDLS